MYPRLPDVCSGLRERTGPCMFELEWAALLEGVTTTEATAAEEEAVAEWEFPLAVGFMTKRAWMRSWPKRGRPLHRLSLKRAITLSEGQKVNIRQDSVSSSVL